MTLPSKAMSTQYSIYIAKADELIQPANMQAPCIWHKGLFITNIITSMIVLFSGSSVRFVIKGIINCGTNITS